MGGIVILYICDRTASNIEHIMSDDKKPLGRPTIYNEELAQRICDLTASSSRGLKILCNEHDDLPVDSVVYQWLAKYPGFSSKYREAKEQQGLCYSEKVMETIWNVDERTEAIAKAKLILDASKWHLSKLAPKTFGDRKEEDKVDTTKAVIEALAPLIKKHEKDY